MRAMRIPVAALAALLAAILIPTSCKAPDEGLSDGAMEHLASAFVRVGAGASKQMLLDKAPALAAGGWGATGDCGDDVAKYSTSYSTTYRLTCTAGGRIELQGTASANISQNGTGTVSVRATETITDWRCYGDYVFNGDPYISYLASANFVNGALSPAGLRMYLNGGVKWGTGSNQTVQIDLEANVDANGHGWIQGSFGGETIDIRM